MKEIQTCGAYLGLEDAPNEETLNVFIEKSEDIKDVLALGYAAGAPGPNGSITIYKDCDGFFRGTLEVFRAEKERIACEFLEDIEIWFDENYKEIQ